MHVGVMGVLAWLWVFALPVGAIDAAQRAEAAAGLSGPACSVEVWEGELAGSGAGIATWSVPAAGGEGHSDRLSPAEVQAAREENDDLVPIALATFGVAAATMVAGLLAYLVRVRLGLVKPPPPPEERHGAP